ncbi:MAG: LamG domain-containing protein [Gammaproteobacteria bacterium]
MNISKWITALIATLMLCSPLAAQAEPADGAALRIATLQKLFGGDTTNNATAPAAPTRADADDGEAPQGCGGVPCLFDTCGCWEQCTVGICTACGGTGQVACLDGDESRPCRDNFVQETAGICVTCGFTGSVACLDGDDPSACRENWTQEVAGICAGCGDAFEPVCADSENPNCMAGNNNVFGTCTPCGGPGEPICLEGDTCEAWHNDVGGVCTPCGGPSEPVCLSGAQCMPRNQSLTGVECLACGAPGTAACFNDFPRCDDPHPNDAYAGLCTAGACGGDQQITCEMPGVPRCDAGLTVWDADAVRPALQENFIGPLLEGAAPIVDILEEFGFAVQASVDNTDYCVLPQPTDFARDQPADNWSSEPADRGARTVFLIHGLGGGGYDEFGGFNLLPEAFQSFGPSNRRLYNVDYNASAAIDVDGSGDYFPFRIFAQNAAGLAEVVYAGDRPIDGTNFTFRDVADFIRDASLALPTEGKVMVVGVSLGGYVAKELVHRHYDEMRYRGREIAQVHFFGHPHLGYLIEPLDAEVASCTNLAPLGGAIGFTDPTMLAQLCLANRWLHGWDAASAYRIDESEYPQIRWGNSWGETGAGNYFLPPFSEELLGVDPAILQGDGTVPSESANGADIFNRFWFDDVVFDLNVGGGCGHVEFDCYLSDIDTVDPMHFSDDALCGDFDFSAGVLDQADVTALQAHLAGSLPFDAAQLERCDVAGSDGACSVLDAVVLALSTATTPAGLAPRPPGVQQNCAAADDLTHQLVAYWPFDDVAGPTVVNGAPTCSRFDATLVGNASLQPGFVGAGALQVNGNGSHAGISDPVALNALEINNNLSFATWVLPTGPGSGSSVGGILVNKEGEYQFARFADGTIRWTIHPRWSWVNSGATAPIGTWTHLAFTVDSIAGEVRTYQNGALVSVEPFVGASGDRHPESPQLRLGSRQNSAQHLQGQLDEAALWHRVINAREVAALYNNGAGAPIESGHVCVN